MLTDFDEDVALMPNMMRYALSNDATKWCDAAYGVPDRYALRDTLSYGL